MLSFKFEFVFSQQYLWEDNRCVAEWMSCQLESANSLVNQNIKCLQRDSLTQHFQILYNEVPTATCDLLVQFIHTGLSQQHKTDLLTALMSLDPSIATTATSCQNQLNESDQNESNET